MADIVLNTNAFRIFFDDAFLDKVVAKCDHIYVAKCSWEKELVGVYVSLIQTLYSSTRKLEKKNKFHEKNVGEIVLPGDLAKELEENGASLCDKKIATLAYDRRSRSGQSVWLISSDPHFQNLRLSFERHGINIKHRQQFISEY